MSKNKLNFGFFLKKKTRVTNDQYLQHCHQIASVDLLYLMAAAIGNYKPFGKPHQQHDLIVQPEDNEIKLKS